MSQLVVLTFDNEATAGNVLRDLRQVEQQGGIRFDDTAVIVKDQLGTVKIDNELSSATEAGMVAGGILGPMVMFLFPIAGIAVGAATGGLIGRMFDQGVDKNFAKDVSEALQPGNSALFLVVREANPAMALAALEPYKGKGTVHHTTLSPEMEANLRHALQDRTAGA